MELTMNFTTPHSSPNITVPLFWQTVMGPLEICMMSICFISGLSTHSYVIWLIVSETESGFASEFFNLNFSVCEIVFSVDSLLFLVNNWFPHRSLSEITSFCFGIIITGCPLFQSLICVERYLAVVHPVIFLKFKPLRYRLICCSVAWTYVFGTCLFCMFTFVALIIDLYIWFYSLQFILFLSVQLFYLVSVLRALKQSGPGDRRREEENNVKRRAFLIILVNTISLAITYVPFIITGFFSIASNQSIQILWSLSYICFMLAGFVQPGLYLHRTGKLLLFCKKT